MLVYASIVTVAACISSCTKEYNDFSYKDRKDYAADSLFFKQPCYMSDAIPADVAAALSTAFPVKGTPKDAVVAILTSDEIAANPEIMSNTFDNEGMVVIYNPDENKVKNALSPEIPSIKSWDLSELSFLCVNQIGESCMVREIPNIIYEDVIPIVRWMTEVYPPSESIDDILNFHQVSASVAYELKDQEITHVVLSKVDRLSGKGNVTLSLSVCPLHRFGDTADDGYDYYIVKSTMSVESKEMYSGNFTKKHGGVKARICGFYLKSMAYDVSMIDASGKAIGEFCTVPLPATAIGSTTHTDSFSFNVSGCISGSPDNSMLSTGVSFSSAVTNTVNDVSLYNNHHDNIVSYNLSLGNLPHYLTKIAISDPPEAAVKTLDISSSWVWRTKVPDGSEDEFSFSLKVRDLVYGASYFYTTSADYHDLEFSVPGGTSIRTLPVPMRVAKGKVSIMHSSGVLDYVKLVNVDTAKEYKKTDDYEVFEFTVPEGKYNASFGLEGAEYTYDRVIDVPRCGVVSLNTKYGFVKSE